MSSGKWRPFCFGLNVFKHFVSEPVNQNKGNSDSLQCWLSLVIDPENTDLVSFGYKWARKWTQKLLKLSLVIHVFQSYARIFHNTVYGLIFCHIIIFLKIVLRMGWNCNLLWRQSGDSRIDHQRYLSWWWPVFSWFQWLKAALLKLSLNIQNENAYLLWALHSGMRTCSKQWVRSS